MFQMLIYRLLVLNFSLAIVGCSANWNSIYREHGFDLDEREGVPKSVFVDIQQREILVANRTICAAPSPDVMAAFSAQLAAEGVLPNGPSGELAAALQTSAAYVGVRSRNIQFFRDQLYSFCLDRMNDTLDDAQHNFYKSRLQRYAIAMAAVEQLTDSTPPPSVILNSTGEASVAGNADALKSQLEEIKKQKQALQDSGEGEDGSAQGGDGDQLAALVKEEKALEEKLRSVKLLAVTGSSKGEIGQPQVGTKQQDAQVANAVAKIVVTTLMTDDTPLLCIERLINLENRPHEETIHPNGMKYQVRPPLDEADLAIVDYCKKVLIAADGKASPIHNLDPELKSWLIK